MDDPPMHPEPISITLSQVAALMGCAPSTMGEKIGELRRAHGFPPPIPHSRRYSRAQVLAWINGHRPPAPAPDATLEQDVAACEAVLIGRARAMLAAE